jgi:3-oxoacyl-[acyl-carrier-protein] synthase-3
MSRPGGDGLGLRVAGTGSYLPGSPLDQEDVRRFLRRYPDGLSAEVQEQLLRETGIATRYYAIDPTDESQRESNTSLAAAAGRRALEAAGWSPEDVDLLVVSTVVPDHLMPPTSTLVQEALGIPRCAEVEITANCTAPYKALAFAASHLRLGLYRRALVCCSHYVSFLGFPPWSNPKSMGADHGLLRWIVSDGGGALALECGQPDIELRIWLESANTRKRPGMSLSLGAAEPDLLRNFELGKQHATQKGRTALREGFLLAFDGFERFIEECALEPASIEHFVPAAIPSMHVVGKLRRLFAERFGVRPDAWRVNLDRLGYVGGVGFLITVDELARTGQLRPGAIVCSAVEESSKWMCAGAVFRWNP